MLFDSGSVSSQWKAQIKPVKKITKTMPSDELAFKSVFYLKNAEGLLQPDQSCLLDVYFEPKIEGKCDMWKVILSSEQNNKTTKFRLEGYGLEPMLKIVEEDIKFEPTVPYIENYQFFTIENLSPFPIEVFFSDFDRYALQNRFCY